MSVRIYELSKDIGMDNAELIKLLKERGYQVRSASSTVDNISAESLREEFGNQDDSSAAASTEEKPVSVSSSEKPATKIPSGALVRSKEDVERERAEREAEEAKKKAPPSMVPPRPSSAGAPPPLPAGPAVTIRKGGGMAPPPVSVPPKAPALPKSSPAPVLRTDLPKSPPASEPPATPPPPGSAPKGKAPPPLSRPAPAAPPRVSAPRTVAPPTASSRSSDDAAAGSETSGAEVAKPADLRKLQVKSPIVVRDFALQIGKKPFQLISELMELSIFASMNTAIEEDVAVRIALNAGYELEVRHRGEAQQAAKEEKKVVDESELMEPRPPVVCVLGHVDHGKTTLLDTIRKANVAAKEAGGITQHVGAYQIEHGGKKISFIDTPGHAAFSNMRARGAGVTDIAVLVVAADDGFMPQTDEALSHVRKANVPIVVAINKMDAPGANTDKVMRQMQERDLSPEEWGGETLSAKISALKGDGVEDLLDSILLQAEIMETLVANPRADAEGTVLEAQKEMGRGSTAAVIVQRGTLKPGMALVSGENYCRIRQLLDDNGKQLKSAPPSTPVKVVGWSGPPSSGDRFTTVKNEREAKRIAEDNERERKRLEAEQRSDSGGATIDDLFAAIEKTQKTTFSVVVKADVYGTAEALVTSLLNIKSDKINLNVIDMGVGPVTRNDVMMADAGESAIVAFNVGLENGVAAAAKHAGIPIISHSIIYELIDRVKDSMADLLEPERRENKVGAAEVRAVFPVARGYVAGCMVTEGRVVRDYLARMYRGREMICESSVRTLRRFKDDVNEVRAGYECGVALQGFSDYQEGDTIEVFEVSQVKPAL